MVDSPFLWGVSELVADPEAAYEYVTASHQKTVVHACQTYSKDLLPDEGWDEKWTTCEVEYSVGVELFIKSEGCNLMFTDDMSMLTPTVLSVARVMAITSALGRTDVANRFNIDLVEPKMLIVS